jgi:hypothetical protein
MTKSIEYRVRAVTRFIVTEHDPVAKTTTQIAEVDGGETANLIAEAFAAQVYANRGKLGVAIPVTAPLPGKVMRCKVVLSSRMANVTWANDAEGKPLGRTVTIGEGEYAHTAPDPRDPTNWRPDGENLGFSAVCAGFDANGVPNVEENRIFGYWSPNVSMTMTVRNQAVLDNLEQGREYYVDFTPAPKS